MGQLLSAGGILKGAFGLFRDHPRAVAAWCLVETAASALAMIAMRPVNRLLAEPANANLAQPAIPAVAAALVLSQLVGFLVYTIVLVAAMRAVLRPREDSFAFLRFGGDELRLFGLGILWVVLLYLATAIGVALFAIIAAFATRATGIASFMIVVGIGLLVVLALLVWLQMRLGLAFPLTVLRRRFTIGESWRVTRGHVWPLLAASAVILLLLVLLFVLFAAAAQGPYWSEVLRGGFGSYEAQQASARQAEANLAVSPMTVIVWIVSGIVAAFGAALLGGATASAARLLVTDLDTIVDTFA